MANTKSAIKRIRRISRQTAVNRIRRSKFKNAIKKMMDKKADYIALNHPTKDGCGIESNFNSIISKAEYPFSYKCSLIKWISFSFYHRIAFLLF